MHWKAPKHLWVLAVVPLVAMLALARLPAQSSEALSPAAQRGLTS